MYRSPAVQNNPNPAYPAVHLKRFSLPEFSGHRKDWPEFRAVWRHLAEGSYASETALACELKRSLKGEALERVKNIYITRPDAYGAMWKRLSEYYDDVTASVQAAMKDLHNLKPVPEGDFSGFIKLVDIVEGAFAQLEELKQADTINLREVDVIVNLLPTNTKMTWIREHHRLSVDQQLKPLAPFMEFLIQERATLSRIAESQKRTKEKGHCHTVNIKQATGRVGNTVSCVIPSHKEGKHKTAFCREFKRLTIGERYSKVKDAHACFRCFGNHKGENCPSDKSCGKCGKQNHHTLLCRKPEEKPQELLPKEAVVPEGICATTKTYSNEARNRSDCALYPIQQGVVINTGKKATIFCDGGSNSSYITHRAANRLGAKKLDRYTLDVTTMGGIETTYDTALYQFSLRTESGRVVDIQAYGMEKITGPVTQLSEKSIRRVFPKYDPLVLQRKSKEVDILLGADYFGLHPKHEVCSSGEHLSIMRGELGVCLQGYHPDLCEHTEIHTSLAKEVHGADLAGKRRQTEVHLLFNKPSCLPPAHFPEDSVICPNKESETLMTRLSEEKVASFIEGEELGTKVKPFCGDCKCRKCPTVGHTFSFREQQELDMIRSNLEYDSEKQCWITSYPWLVHPSQLPDNRNTAVATLKRTERVLSKDQKWAETYTNQMQDLIKREVARRLTEEDIREWTGPKFYLSHLAVRNPNSVSTPVRIVFNSSQPTQGVSLNSALAKGPDSYMNNLLGLLLRWREEKVAIVGDIRKMFNSVHLQPAEQHCHRFLWRDLDMTIEPQEYVITRVNMGDRPAPAISTEALYATADKFAEIDPRAAQIIKGSSYVDDILDSFRDIDCAVEVLKKAELILSKGNFHIKYWLLTGGGVYCRGEQQVTSALGVEETGKPLLKGRGDTTRVLGIGWKPACDCLVFETTLNFSVRKRGIRTRPNLSLTDVPEELPQVLTRRMVLEQVMAIFDPLGLLSPFTLRAKIYLRETWALNLGWDEPLPPSLYQKWIQFFCSMFQVDQLLMERNLHPDKAVGSPWLILMSDGSDVAYGFAAYIRWQLEDGGVWCRLIMSKCRIAPLTKRSTPQMELNGAVLSKRGRAVIEKEMRFKFEKILHLVDSETVLSMINKVSTRFKVYEGVRIGEIQAATDGDMSSWAWVSGQSNMADLVTRGCEPAKLGPESEWFNGPAILYKPLEHWGLKFGIQKADPTPGEKKGHIISTSTHVEKHTGGQPGLLCYERFSSIRRVCWVVARLLSIAKAKSFKGGRQSNITPHLLDSALQLIIKNAQCTLGLEPELNADVSHGRYASVNPKLTQDNVWIVGSRLRQFNPMTPDGVPQRLLPPNHTVTRLLMKQCHEDSGHRGRDGTLAKFREHYWTTRGSKLAWLVKNSCQLCKLRDPQLLSQVMGALPEARTKPSPPFTRVMVDFFGPFAVRGEVQKRTSGKAYGILFTDLVMRAVHIEATFGYDTQSFLMALSRFANVRGWPEIIYSDPGSQLCGADRVLKEAWNNLERDAILRKSSENGLKWIFGPADSPWHQGAVESLVKCAKKAIHYAIHNQRLSPSEFLTLCAEIANLLNERPIGTLPSKDSAIGILTPNSLLLGRATAKNPGGWQPQHPTVLERLHLVQSLADQFWQRWIELCAPHLLVQRKWYSSASNLQKGDVVLVADKNTLRGDYRLGLVRDVHPGVDGRVRQVMLSYKNFKVGEKLCCYSGSTDTVVTRSVQRLALLVPIDHSN